MPQHDQLHRYLFENFAVRGELVTVSETLQQILDNHTYPQPVKTVLAELLVATSLLTATLKFAGDITVQLQGDGPLSLAVINGNNQQQMRGVARVQGDIPDNADLKTLVGNGYLVITITPEEGERYQGVVGLEGDTLAACLEGYFLRSEQLPTRLFIRTGDVDGKPAAGGMLLQVMPAQNAQAEDFDHLAMLTETIKSEEQLPTRLFIRTGDVDGKPAAGGMLLQVMPAQNAQAEDFDHLAMLTETIKSEELLTLPANDVLWRLYHEEEVTLYDPQNVEFKCTCSRERCAGALKTLPDEEVDSILAEEGEIDMHCDYCGNHYLFNAMDIAEIRNNASPADPQVH
ncbi:TPA: Hsp33 family molecular chaperone HslO [Salmonella enterica]